MTSFKQFILEEAFDIDKFFEECAPILKQYKEGGSFLYRGSPERGEFLKDKFKERSGPKDTPAVIHDAMNYNFDKKWGIEPRNWMFASFQQGQASAYGPVRAIFPIGDNFEFVYSDEVYDGTNTVNWMRNELKHLRPELSFDERTAEIVRQVKKEYADRFDYKHTRNIVDGLRNRYECEVMFKGDSFYSVYVYGGNIFKHIKERLRNEDNV